MIAAFAEAGAVLERADYTTAAVRAADFILDAHAHGRRPAVPHHGMPASPPKLDGYLEDYAFLIDALVGCTRRRLTSAG